MAFNGSLFSVYLVPFVLLSSLLGVCPLAWIAACHSSRLRTTGENVGGSLEIAVEDAALRGTERLARFFPDVRRVTIPAIVELRHGVHLVLRHAVWIEFAGANVAIFFCGLPLEFEDRVSMENDRGQAFTAKVVAVQYHHGMNGVAVQIQDDRFAG